MSVLPAEGEPLAIYSGRTCLGLIHVRADSFAAELPDGRALNVYASRHEAASAIPKAYCSPSALAYRGER